MFSYDENRDYDRWLATDPTDYIPKDTEDDWYLSGGRKVKYDGAVVDF